MKDRSRIRGIVPRCVMSVLLIMALVFYLMVITDSLSAQESEIYAVVCLGDSILGNERGETSVTSRLAQYLGVEVYNGGLGGTSMAMRKEDTRAADSLGLFSGTELVRALVYRDFGAQNGSVQTSMLLEYYPEAIMGLSQIDPEKTQVLILQYGVNDYLLGVPLDNEEDPCDPYTFGGALRRSLELLQENYPSLRVILVTPAYCWFPEENLNCEEKDFGQGTLEEYVELELQIAREYGVEALDNYHNVLQSSGAMEEWESYTVDGLHLNETGRDLIAGRIAEVIRGE